MCKLYTINVICRYKHWFKKTLENNKQTKQQHNHIKLKDYLNECCNFQNTSLCNYHSRFIYMHAFKWI